jgi:hypothetical protein
VVEPFFIKKAVMEDMRGNDEMGGPPVKPEEGVVSGNAAAHLHAPRPRIERLAGRCLVAGTEHDNVTAREIIPAIHVGVVGGGKFGGKIRVQGSLIAGQGGADNLFHSALVQIYAGPETHHALSKKKKGCRR